MDRPAWAPLESWIVGGALETGELAGLGFMASRRGAPSCALAADRRAWLRMVSSPCSMGDNTRNQEKMLRMNRVFQMTDQNDMQRFLELRPATHVARNHEGVFRPRAGKPPRLGTLCEET